MATSRASSARAAVDLTFEELYRGHRADVYRAALRELGNVDDAEDVTQAAFADAYRAVLRGTRPQSPRAWLLAISENVRRRRFRTAQRRPREELVDDADFPLAAELPYEQTRALAEALEALPPEQRRVFVLREIVGLSYDEIAEEVDSTVASIQMLLFRARRSLRADLEPPVVAVRRPGFLPPLPGWLAWALSRVEVATLTPRAAGALGATVLAVAGATVAVPVPQADAREWAQANAEPQGAAVAKPAAAHPVVGGSSVRAAGKQQAGPLTAGRTTSSPRPAPRWQPGATTPQVVPAHVPGSAEPTPTAVPVQATPQVFPSPELPRVAVTQVDGMVGAPVEPPLPPVSLPTPPVLPTLPPVTVAVPVPPVTVPVPVPVPTVPALPPPVETVTGAAGAAGASAPPLPVPLPPLPPLPPMP
jgi:RNA polymerase sigma-70 factor, ECF subfamily